MCSLLFVFSCGCSSLEKERRHFEPTIAGDRKATEESVQPAEAPAPYNGLATLTGRLSDRSRIRMTGHLILAKAVPTGKPGLFLLEVDNQNLKMASINQEGVFRFEKVIPGKYGVCLWDPLSAFPLNDPKTGNTLFVDILPDQTLDLGMLEIPYPQ